MLTKPRVLVVTLSLVVVGAAASVALSVAPSDTAPASHAQVRPAAGSTAPQRPGPDPELTPTKSQAATIGQTSGTAGRLVDGTGATVYTFAGDRVGVSTCTGACSQTWPPVRSMGGKPQPIDGLPPSAVGSIQRPDGTDQVTLYGMPLYHYVGDDGIGKAAGDGKTAFGGHWTAQAPAAPPSKQSAATPVSHP
jgi:predicted lipoprotein with Yx(FWY)xxD motif